MLDELVDSLLYEGYALYPYTPGATKNATPTPFGIVYPPAYAAECEGAHDHARLECVRGARARAECSCDDLRRRDADGRERSAGARSGGSIGGRRQSERPHARFTLRARRRRCASSAAACTTQPRYGRASIARAALADSLISTHIVVQVSAGRFVSPLESRRESVNIWPVLASDNDDTVLGAAIVLPDHPQIAPRSHGNLFDNTEIEEALVLHVHTLSDDERERPSPGPGGPGDARARARTRRRRRSSAFTADGRR